jgi:chloramphenicol 3-O-phosphotransferase
MRRQLTRGTLVVVGGHSRGVGKTSLVEQLLRTTREPWVAIKISGHRHAAKGARVPFVKEARRRSPRTQTGRYLAAGAARAFLVRAPDAALARAAAFIESLRESGANVIVESNRIVRHVTPDAVLFVVDPHVSDWKPTSALCLKVADAVGDVRRLMSETSLLNDDDDLHTG